VSPSVTLKEATTASVHIPPISSFIFTTLFHVPATFCVRIYYEFPMKVLTASLKLTQSVITSLIHMRGAQVKSHALWTSRLDWNEWAALSPSTLPRTKSPVSLLISIWDWVSPRFGLDPSPVTLLTELPQNLVRIIKIMISLTVVTRKEEVFRLHS
jgi:hypothetical protein